MESVHYLMKVVAGAPEHPAAVVLRHGRAGRGAQRHRDAPRRSRAMDALSGAGDRLPSGHSRARGAALADRGFRRRISPRDERAAVSRRAFRRRSRTERSSTSATRLCPTRCAGIHTKLNVIWDWEPPAGAGDTHFAFYQAARAPASRCDRRQRRSLSARSSTSSRRSGGEAAGARGGAGEDRGAAEATIPARRRGPRRGDPHHDSRCAASGPRAHFAQVTASFLKYLRDRRTLPAWERPNMLAKYYVTTTGTELSRKSAPQPAPRIAPR